MRTSFLIILCFIVLPNSYAQKTDFVVSGFTGNYDGVSLSEQWDWRKRDALTKLRYDTGRTFSDYEYEQLVGNSYFDKKFHPGHIYMDDKVISKNVYLRYNAFMDEIEISKNNSFEVILKNKDVSCSLGKTKYIYSSFAKKEGEKVENGYFSVLYEGKEFKLLFRKVKIYKEAKEAKNSMVKSVPAKFVVSTGYYFKENSKDKAILLKTNKKKITQMLKPEYKSQLEKIIKKEKLDLNKTEDLIKVFSFYDSLI